jgi:hypothetical protein
MSQTKSSELKAIKPNPSSMPQPERARIVTPPVQNSIIVEQLEEMRPVVATREGPVILSRYVIQTRATIDPPPALQAVITIGQSPMVKAPPLQGRLAPSNQGQAILAPLPIVSHNVVVNQPAQLVQIAQVQQVQPAQVIRPPLIIQPASRVRPTSYVYIPGLARDEFVQRPCPDLASLKARLRATFGCRLKRVYGGRDGQNFVEPDPFITGSVASLCDLKGATPINCGTAFLWALISSTDRNLYQEESTGLRYFDANRKMYTSKAFKVMGAPQDNYAALTPGKKIPPKELVYDVPDTPHCVGSEYMAQRKAAKPDEGNQPAPNEPRALAGLRDDDVLYIVGHGNHRGGMLVYKVPVPSSHPVQDEQQAKQQGVCAHHTHFERWYVDPQP